MGIFRKLLDAILFLFFLLIAIVAPLFDSQSCLPVTLFPDFLVDLKKRYSHEYGDYLVEEKPDFFVGLVWLQLLFQWPLCLLNMFALLSRKSWFGTTCLIYGVSLFTSMFAILAELHGSPKSSDKLLMVYTPFLGFGALAILRGLLPNSSKASSNIGRKPGLARKKRV